MRFRRLLVRVVPAKAVHSNRRTGGVHQQEKPRKRRIRGLENARARERRCATLGDAPEVDAIEPAANWTEFLDFCKIATSGNL